MLHSPSIQLKQDHQISLKLWAVLYNLPAHKCTLLHRDLELWDEAEGVWTNLIKYIPYLYEILKQ